MPGPYQVRVRTPEGWQDLIMTGPAGVQGPAGPQGPPGPGGADAAYIHTQSVLASTWVVTHTLNKRPSVMVVDSGDNVVIPDVRYDSNSQITVVFGSATIGKVYLN